MTVLNPKSREMFAKWMNLNLDKNLLIVLNPKSREKFAYR